MLAFWYSFKTKSDNSAPTYGKLSVELQPGRSRDRMLDACEASLRIPIQNCLSQTESLFVYDCLCKGVLPSDGLQP